MKVEELFLCECGSPDHMFYIKYDDEWKDVFMYAHLRKRSFWNRLKYGIKYIFGYQSIYGAFDEIILRDEDLEKLQRIIDKAKGNIKKKQTMTDKQKQALRVLRKLLNINGEPLITKDEWFLLFDFVVGDTEESTTITIPKDLKGTDTDGGVVGEKGEQGEQPTNKNFKERYENIAKSDWFKKTHKDISIGEEQPTEEEMVGMGELGKVWNEQAIISRLDRIIELLERPIIMPFSQPIQPLQPIYYDTNKVYCDTANTEGGDE